MRVVVGVCVFPVGTTTRLCGSSRCGQHVRWCSCVSSGAAIWCHLLRVQHSERVNALGALQMVLQRNASPALVGRERRVTATCCRLQRVQNGRCAAAAHRKAVLLYSVGRGSRRCCGLLTIRQAVAVGSSRVVVFAEHVSAQWVADSTGLM